MDEAAYQLSLILSPFTTFSATVSVSVSVSVSNSYLMSSLCMCLIPSHIFTRMSRSHSLFMTIYRFVLLLLSIHLLLINSFTSSSILDFPRKYFRILKWNFFSGEKNLLIVEPKKYQGIEEKKKRRNVCRFASYLFPFFYEFTARPNMI